MQKYGNSSGLIKQPGSKIVEKLDGSIEATLILEGASEHYGSRPTIGSRHPDLNLLSCHNVESDFGKLSKIRITASYVGITGTETPWFLEGTGAVDKDSILTHPKFLSDLGGTKASPKNKAIFDASTGDFIGFPSDATENLAGVDSWYVPHVSFRLSQWTYTEPDFDKIGTIVIPPITLKKPANSKNFLQGPITYRQVGELYQVVSEIWASGPVGWNAKIYDPEALN